MMERLGFENYKKICNRKNCRHRNNNNNQLKVRSINP